MWLVPGIALGQGDLTADQVEEYESSLAKGAAKFRDGNYSGARAELERAYELFPNPTILFSIAGTHRREGDREQALRSYRRFLDECATELCRVENKKPVSIAEQTIAELEAELSAERGKEDQPEDIIAIQEPGERDQPSRPGAGWRWTGVAFMAVGAGALAFAGVDQVRASGLESDIDDELDRNGNMWTPALAAKEQDGEDLSERARLLAIGGGVVAAAGVGLFIYGMTREPDEEELSVVPSAGSDRWGLAVVGRF